MANYLELAGQLMMVRLFGTELDADTDAFLRAHKVRGACLFRQNMTDAAQLTRFTSALRDASNELAGNGTGRWNFGSPCRFASRSRSRTE